MFAPAVPPSARPTSETVPSVIPFSGWSFVIAAWPVSPSTATPVGDSPGVHRDPVLGPIVPVTSTIVTLLLVLFATAARPNLGRMATPRGVPPARIGEPIVPTAPAVPPPT